MKKIIFTIVILLISFSSIHAQFVNWGVDFNYFFDNTEFAKSKLVKDQTMSGVHFVPKLDISIDTTQSIVAGIDILMLSGATKRFQDFFPLAYYQLKKTNQQLLIGSFPRSKSISYYSDFLFADSIQYFRPNLHGIFWNIGNTKNYFNIWLDWTGRDTEIDRETFYAGISSHSQIAKMFFVDFQSYLFHFANTNPRKPINKLCDNAQALLMAGIDSEVFNNNANIILSAGLFGGYERERTPNSVANLPLGFVSELKFDTKYVGVNMKVYTGSPHFIFYSKYGNQLYWGNTFLRSKSYMENKVFLRFLNSKYIQGNVALKFHISEGQFMHEQVLTLNASIDKLISKK